MIKFFVILIFLLTQVLYARVWEDQNGQHLDADLIGYKNGIVYLKNSSGKTVKVLLKKLSSKDQDFIKEFVRNNREPAFKDNELFPIKVNGLWGYIDKRGRVAINPQFSHAQYFSNGLAFVKTVGDLEGYINTYGEFQFKLRPRNNFIDEYKDFSEGLAVCLDPITKLYGYINTSGEWAIKPKYFKCNYFSEGLAAVLIRINKKNHYFYIKKNGEKAFDQEFSSMRNFSEGRAVVRNLVVKDKYGIIDKNGNWILQPKYETIYDFHGGVAEIWTDKAWEIGNFIDKTGKVVFGKIRYKDNSGVYQQTLITKTFFEGYAPVLLDGYWLIYKSDFTKSRKKIKVSTIDVFQDGMARCMKKPKGLWGFINTSGSIAVQCKYVKVNHFKNGLALVEDKTHQMYVDKRGSVIWKSRFPAVRQN